MFGTLLQIALGGALGASARFLANLAAARWLGTSFPWATLFVNVLGSFLMGVLFVALVEKGASRAAPFLMTGILGGFTTFSAFSLDAMTLWERGDAMQAAAYVAGSVGISILALMLGVAVTRGVFA